ncbi:DUF2939 domain-containing protein [Roseococcus sp. SYP-B2431]|uniref:DUF2939 domain-containing protein n=1 Tax=Roseococcus sp. SYP-B2431 TaxID=2496640 RepID=UPI001038CF0E|nr:DUF2939 domain-containing protein [Roseococcus sp. SYP-B2431]TCH99006.1 DUF2939 domain-containing protein [Roseococcus sp. SYP-B2431]
MSGTTASNSWDEIWAEFDARQPVHRAAPARAPEGEARRRRRPAAGLRRLLALIGVGLATVYIISPVASAVQVASAIQRGDSGALAGHVDWESLRPAMAAVLSARARDQEERPMPAFIAGMARDMAAQLSGADALTELLKTQLGHGGTGSARDMLGRVRIVGLDAWEVELSAPRFPRRSARLTLGLTDPWRLRWEVRAIDLP